ncbi:MAG TPA: thioredoxin family protein [Acidimicrobiales bacterium]|jgi:thioredoxin 1|nr:thioredoxin family protein [Acidimicrobiales bacterium]
MSDSAVLAEVTKDDFRDVVSEGTVLVDIWGPDCQPCLTLLPHVEALAEKYAGEMKVVKLEAPKARRLCMELGVMSLPGFLLFRDGEEVARLSDAALTPQRLDQWLDEQRKEVS